MALERDELIAAIDAAFPREPIDGNAFARWGTTYLDANEYRSAIAGRAWHELDREYIVRRHDALGFLDVPGLIAVLPVYLQSVVEEGAWSPAVWMVLLILTRPQRGFKPGLGVPRFKAFVEALTTEQRAAIAAVLIAFAERYGEDSLGGQARLALEGYWNDYLPTGA